MCQCSCGISGCTKPVPFLVLQRLSRIYTTPAQFRAASFTVSFFGDAVTPPPPLGPAEDFSFVPVTHVQQMNQQRPHLGHRHLRLFFPPIAAVAAPGTTTPALPERCGDASPANLAFRIHPSRIRPWLPGNSVPPTSARHAPGPVLARTPTPVRCCDGISLRSADPPTVAPRVARDHWANPLR